MNKTIKCILFFSGSLLCAFIILWSCSGCKAVSGWLYTPYTNVVDHGSNKVITVGVTTSTNASKLAQDAGTIVNTFAPGLGTVVTAGATALLTLIGGFFKHRRVVNAITGEVEEQKMLKENVARALTFSVENYRDVLLTLPSGEVLDTKLRSEAQKHQQQFNVGALVVDTLEDYIHNPEVQEASSKIAEEARRLAATP